MARWRTEEKESGRLYSLTTLNDLDVMRDLSRQPRTDLSWSWSRICCLLARGETRARWTEIDLSSFLTLFTI